MPCEIIRILRIVGRNIHCSRNRARPVGTVRTGNGHNQKVGTPCSALCRNQNSNFLRRLTSQYVRNFPRNNPRVNERNNRAGTSLPGCYPDNLRHPRPVAVFTGTDYRPNIVRPRLQSANSELPIPIGYCEPSGKPLFRPHTDAGCRPLGRTIKNDSSDAA